MDSDLSASAGRQRRTNILSPFFKGTLAKWFKEEGDSIHRNEPLCEVGIERVEFPSPVDGTLLEIRSAAGSTLQFNTVIAAAEVSSQIFDIEDEMLQALGYKVPPDLTWVESAIKTFKRERDEAIGLLRLEFAAALADKVRILTRQKSRWTDTPDERAS